MITDDYKVKLIEVNEKASFKLFNSNKINHLIFENVCDKILDKHFNSSIKKSQHLNNLISIN